ncbi:MAG: DNA repair protein RecN [Candidatus Manganitrophaceae bacterium]
MLRELRIQNYAIISEVSLAFSEGLTVITGETGAGKSILIDALSLILGGRSSPEMIRQGESESLLEARFDPVESPLPEDLFSKDSLSQEWLILKRILSPSGKNRSYLNDSFANLSALKEVGQRLVEIHGQHEHHNLLDLDWQLKLLDSFARLTEQRKSLERSYRAWSGLLEERSALQKLESEGREKRAFLEYQLSEIGGAKLLAGEEEALEKEEKTLRNWESIVSTVEKVYHLLTEEGALLSRLEEAGAALQKLHEMTDEASQENQLWETSKIHLKELSVLLRDRLGNMEYDPDRLQAVTERLYAIQKLKKKYGASVEGILQLQAKWEAELTNFSGSETRLLEITKKIEGAESTLRQQSADLSKGRKKAKRELEKRVKEELDLLGMTRTTFEVSLTEKPLSEDGIDRIEFSIALPGEGSQGLAKIASGGELSRIMLALKVVLAGIDPVGALVFDEVDAGIGGAIAEKVGMRLSKLSETHQVFCITHLPQIARFADHHYFVEKVDAAGRVVTSIKKLSKEGRIDELARMLGGTTITPTTLRHAEELLNHPASGAASAEERVSFRQGEKEKGKKGKRIG